MVYRDRDEVLLLDVLMVFHLDFECFPFIGAEFVDQ